MDNPNMTYGDLFNLFIRRNPDVSRYITDYRPAKGENRIVVWFKNGTEVYVRWVEEIKEFVFSEVE